MRITGLIASQGQQGVQGVITRRGDSRKVAHSDGEKVMYVKLWVLCCDGEKVTYVKLWTPML